MFLDNIDSRVKSQYWDDKSAFKMRKTGIKNTFDAGVNIGKIGSFIVSPLAMLIINENIMYLFITKAGKKGIL